MKQPLHDRIRSDFEASILSGELSPGDRLPIEQELMQHYGCSRMTVNKALSALVAAGLIDRRKKAGTFVAQPRVHSMVLDIADIGSQIRERGQHYDYVTLHREIRAPLGTSQLETTLSGGDWLFQIDGVHKADGVALAIETRLVSVRAVPQIVDVTLEGLSPGSWLLEHVPWSEAETRIFAAGLSRKEAPLLGLPPGAPCLCIERHTWRGPERITYVRQSFVADKYDLIARFGPSAPSA